MSYEPSNEIPHGLGGQQYEKRDAAYKEYVVEIHGEEVWDWRDEALPRNHQAIFNAGWAARKREVDYALDEPTRFTLPSARDTPCDTM